MINNERHFKKPLESFPAYNYRQPHNKSKRGDLHPYMRNDWQGTPAIQATMKAIYKIMQKMKDKKGTFKGIDELT